MRGVSADNHALLVAVKRCSPTQKRQLSDDPKPPLTCVGLTGFESDCRHGVAGSVICGLVLQLLKQHFDHTDSIGHCRRHIGMLMLPNLARHRSLGRTGMARKKRGFGRLRQLPSGRWQASTSAPIRSYTKRRAPTPTSTMPRGWRPLSAAKSTSAPGVRVERLTASRLRPTPVSGWSSAPCGPVPANITSPCSSGSSRPTSATSSW